MRVLGTLDVGGAELRTLDLLPRLVAAGVVVHFVTLNGRPGSLAPVAQAHGATVHPLSLGLDFPRNFLALLRRVRPHAVHADLATFSGAPLLLAAAARVPVRVAQFRSDGDTHGNSLRRRAQRWTMRRLIHTFATDITGVSPGTLTHGYLPTWQSDPRCRVVPNGLDLDRLHRDSGADLRRQIGAAPQEVVCLHVGRPAPEKRRWMLPPMIAELRASGVAARAVLVGPYDGDDDAQLREAARINRVEDRIHLLGSRDDVGTLMSQADVVVLPSDREGLPGVVLEAAALGTPVVASDLPGVCFIADELPGVTVVDRDAPISAWAAAIREVISGDRPTSRDRDLARARFRSSPFSLELAVAHDVAMYQQGLRPEGNS
ncbi:glycosyltransferase family 4 protein [Micromonospora polyrhachis]|uniref:Glycosyltransferase involved in cell wall biosynthesis n=1 Tax=Micromonospora polyrhachis TaxID=1282883 RepID=A0A7W7SUQ0_9ACTN|nr:glycosyltransferase [Micromonospora polyrhachis]MBB4961238.1 glycosyltransferase involved in cell wall biosynthesis [Micromonospora polyrhachis]